jgi:hypothetical protein
MPDQGQDTAQSKTPEVSYSDGFDSKWNEMMDVGKEGTAADTTEAKPATAKKEEPCPGCDKKKAEQEAQAKADAERKPYKVLKVQGKDVPVYSEEELINMAQMGVDYTKKRQSDADEKRKWEGEYEGKHRELTELTEKYEKLFATIKPGERIPGTEQTFKPAEPVSKKSIYEEYGIDPEYADGFQKKMIDDTVAMREKVAAYETKLQQVEAFTNAMVLKETATNLGKVIKEERDKFPIDEIMSEDGSENLTQKQFASMIMAKNEQAKAQGKKPDLAEMSREVVREIHFMQSKSKTVAAPDISNELTPEQFAAKYPDLYKKVADKVTGKAVAEYVETKENLPPSLESRKTEVDLSKINVKKPETSDDWIEAGFNDPKVSSLFQ